jgi:arylsulfatase A-like enzyme
MPARRELHTGRPNFLHRSWGPLEPFDDSMPELLKNAGVYTHLVTDHQHYFEDGGATYHGRFSTWEFFRGQEGDPWIGQVERPVIPDVINARKDSYGQQDAINRSVMKGESDMPQDKTFAAGLDFMRRNRGQDNWFLQIETFDPHEPFFADQKYKDLYAKHYDAHRASGGKPFDWPPYSRVTQRPEEVEHCRHEYAALLSMCDAHLGRVMRAMDEMDMWKETMLIVCTDHGFMLGEHECWAKMWMPFYQEVSHVPLFIWDPRCGKKGEVRKSLVQTIDFAPTILEFFGVARPKDMIGKVLRDVIASDTPVREAGIFGLFGAQVNVTDGRYVYMRAPVQQDDQPLFDYTLMPTRMRSRFSVEDLTKTVGLAEPFGFTKGCRTLKIPAGRKRGGEHDDRFKTLLYDVEKDPQQTAPISDPAVEKRMVAHLVRLMKECEAPPEQFERLGLQV